MLYNYLPRNSTKKHMGNKRKVLLVIATLFVGAVLVGRYSGIQFPTSSAQVPPSSSTDSQFMQHTQYVDKLGYANESRVVQLAQSVASGWTLQAFVINGPYNTPGYQVLFLSPTHTDKQLSVEIDYQFHIVKVSMYGWLPTDWGQSTGHVFQTQSSSTTNQFGNNCTPNSNTLCPWSGWEVQWCNNIFYGCYGTGNVQGSD